MPWIVTLISGTDGPYLTANRLRAIQSGLAALNLPVKDCRWLSAGRACDMDLGHTIVPDRRKTVAAVREIIAGEPIDVVVTGPEARKKKLLLADMDSTLIEQECLDELADFAGFKAQVADITQKAMNGQLTFEPALRERVALLKDMDEAVLQRAFDDRITLMPGGRALVQTMRKNGAYSCLVSGGFTFFTSRVAELLGFDENRGNTLLSDSGRLTGEVAEPILGKTAKLDTLVELCKTRNIETADALAVGDGANDSAMIECAGLGVAFRAHDILVGKSNAQIEHNDLTALLYIQGYTDDEIVKE